jgi:ribonuclease P protein component
MTRADDFRRTVRRGRRSVTPSMVVYRLRGVAVYGPVVGVVVSKQVGGAVVRNRIRRRLQSLCAQAISQLPGDEMIVIRVLPGAHQASWDTLRTEIRGSLRTTVEAS